MNDRPSEAAPPLRPTRLTEGAFAGWYTWGQGGDPFETVNGPFYFKRDSDGVVCVFEPRHEHLNGAGAIHGGALMTFADFSLFAIAHTALSEAKAVTLTCNSEFIAAGVPGALVEGRGEVLRSTRSLVFVRGTLTQAGKPVLAFSGTLKKLFSGGAG
jgi:uncharacterized protein (TIGR00369 family)